MQIAAGKPFVFGCGEGLQALHKILVGAGGCFLRCQSVGKSGPAEYEGIFSIKAASVEGGLVPIVPAFGANVGADGAVDQHGFGIVPPGPTQIAAGRRQVMPKKAAAVEHIAVLLSLWGGGCRGVAGGKGHNVTVFKPGSSAAKDKINIPFNAAAAVGVALGRSGSKLLGADEAVFLQFLGWKGSGEQGVLVGTQNAVLAGKKVPVCIQGNGLPHLFPWRGGVDDGQPPQGHMGGIHHQCGRAEGAPVHAIGHGLLGAVIPLDHSVFANQGGVGPLKHHLFPIDSGGKAQGNGGVIPGQRMDGAGQRTVPGGYGKLTQGVPLPFPGPGLYARHSAPGEAAQASSERWWGSAQPSARREGEPASTPPAGDWPATG